MLAMAFSTPDNMVVTGESFDYGPWRFAPTADPNFTAAYFDQTGLYSFGRQPEACAWNLAQLGGALSLVADADQLTEALQLFGGLYEQEMTNAFFRRLGLAPSGVEDFEFVGELLGWMTSVDAPFEQVFFDWFGGADSIGRTKKSPVAALYGDDAFGPVKQKLTAFASSDSCDLDHVYFAQEKPCTMLIDELEAIWAAIADGDDWSVFEKKLEAIAQLREAYQLCDLAGQAIVSPHKG